VNFSIAQGAGSLSAASAVTNSTGYATVTLSLTNFASTLLLVACVEPGSLPCQTVYGYLVPSASLQLQAVSGGWQIISGQSFQPVTVRVTDSFTPPNPVLGAAVVFQSTVMRPPGAGFAALWGDLIGPPTGVPFILGASQVTVISDANGLASFIPSLGSLTGILEDEVQISAGSSSLIEDVLLSVPQNTASVRTSILQVSGDDPPAKDDDDDAGGQASRDGTQSASREVQRSP
jgi:hypothetical protein